MMFAPFCTVILGALDPLMSNFALGPNTIPLGFIRNRLTGPLPLMMPNRPLISDVLGPVIRLKIVLTFGTFSRSKVVAFSDGIENCRKL